jgi:hypothetical protein
MRMRAEAVRAAQALLPSSQSNFTDYILVRLTDTAERRATYSAQARDAGLAVLFLFMAYWLFIGLFWMARQREV